MDDNTAPLLSLSPPTEFPPLPTHCRLFFMSHSKQLFKPRAGVSNGSWKEGCSPRQDLKKEMFRPATQEDFLTFLNIFYKLC